MVYGYCRETLRGRLRRLRTKLMFQAIRSDSVVAVKLLLRTVCRDDCSAAREVDFSALHIAAICQNIAMINVLLDHGADVNAREPAACMRPLHLAVMNFRESTDIVENLLLRGSEVNAVDSQGNTSLHLAIMCDNCNVALIKVLLRHGASVSVKNNSGKNPFQTYNEELSRRQHLGGVNPKLLRLILPNDHGVSGMSPLHEACVFHRAGLIRELVRLGADVEVKDSHGYTPLYYAVVAHGTDENKRSTLRTLLDLGADINQKFLIWLDCCTERKTTALHLTIMFEDHDIARILVEHAAKLVELRSGVERRALSKRNRKLINSEYGALHRRILNLINLEDRALRDLPPRLINAWINVRNDYDRWRPKCAKELRLMRRTRVGNSTIRFFDFLNEEEAAFYARNKELVEAFEASKTKFPIYWGMMKANLDKGLERHRLVENAAIQLSDILKFADHTHVAFEIILSYFSNQDLRILTGLS